MNESRPIIRRVYNYALTEGDPPGSWSEAVLSVIHKENKDPTQWMSYRPMSLLCVYLKILTWIIAKRIQKHINKLVKPDQTGFINNRQGVDNVRRALNLQSIAAKWDTPSMLLSLDADKAFDRVEVRYFIKIPDLELELTDTAPTFSPWDKVRTRETLLSPSLFALSIEPLGELIRTNPLIQGISV